MHDQAAARLFRDGNEDTFGECKKRYEEHCTYIADARIQTARDACSAASVPACFFIAAVDVFDPLRDIVDDRAGKVVRHEAAGQPVGTLLPERAVFSVLTHPTLLTLPAARLWPRPKAPRPAAVSRSPRAGSGAGSPFALRGRGASVRG